MVKAYYLLRGEPFAVSSEVGSLIFTARHKGHNTDASCIQ